MFGLPYSGTLVPSSQARFTMIMPGCNQSIANAFAHHENFWLNAPRKEKGHRQIRGQSRNLCRAAERKDWQLIANRARRFDAQAWDFWRGVVYLFVTQAGRVRIDGHRFWASPDRFKIGVRIKFGSDVPTKANTWT